MYAVWPWPDGSRPRLRMGVVRRSDLPYVERAGDTQILDLPSSAGLLETAHAMFFPSNIVGAEFNFHGPRVGSLALYLREKGPPDTPDIRFLPLLRRDAARQLDGARGVTLLQLRIHRAYSSLLNQLNDGLGASLDATAEATGSQLVELILRARPRSRQPLSARLLQAVRGLAGSSLVRDSAEVFKVKVLREDGGPIEEIDLLNDHLVSVRRVVREHSRGRVVEAASVFEAIEDGYTAMRPELERAPAAG